MIDFPSGITAKILQSVLPGSQADEWRIQCPICRRAISAGDEVLQCGNCCRLFHEPHILAYLQDSSEVASCPVCTVDLEESLREFE